MIGTLLSLIMVVLLTTGAAAAHLTGLITLPLPSFLKPQRAPEEVLIRMYEATMAITSSTSTFDVTVKTVPRDPALQPLPDTSSRPSPNAAALERDQVRLDDARNLLLAIQQYQATGGEGIYYPRQLGDILTPENTSRVTAEITNRRYSYSQTARGQNFSFTIRLETPEAQQAYLNATGETATSPATTTAEPNLIATAITLTAASRPVSVAISGTTSSHTHDFFNSVPVDFHVTVGATGTADLAQNDQEATAATYNLRGSLKMGGRTMAGDVDTTLLNNLFYLRLNEMPSFGVFDPSALKGQWIKVDLEEQFGRGGFAPEEFQRIKQEQQRQAALQRRISKIAAETARDIQLLRIVEEVPPGSGEDNTVYHYKLTVDREKLAQFIEKISQKMAAEPDTPLGEEELQKLREGLASPEWQRMYDVWQKNSTLELWIDRTTFYPRRWQLTMAVAPSDSVLKFQGKQLSATFSGELDAINEPVIIQAPDTFISLEEAMLLVTDAPLPGQVQGIHDISWPAFWRELQTAAL